MGVGGGGGGGWAGSVAPFDSVKFHFMGNIG